MTGALHEDGLADTFDGMGGGRTREKALDIMKDSRLGTYGALALILALALKAYSLMTIVPTLIPLTLLVGHSLSRLSTVLVIATSRYARKDGTGKSVSGRVSMANWVIALLTSAIVMAAWLALHQPLSLICGCAGLVVGHILMRLFFERKLEGYTGDNLGAVQQTSEIGFYLGLVAWA